MNNNNRIESLDFKVVIIGDHGAGKTTLIERLRSGHFETKYIATRGIKVSPLTYLISSKNNLFKVTLHMAEGENYQASDGAIVLFDMTSRRSYKSVESYVQGYRHMCPHAPLVIVGNKVDCQEQQVLAREILLPRRIGVDCYLVSAKCYSNSEKPFLNLIRVFLRDPRATFCEIPAMRPVHIIKEHSDEKEE
jgi:GTP-binding nuclear protein Ran